MFSDLILVAWNWPWWEYLPHRSWQTLKIRAYFPPGGMVIKYLQAYPWVEPMNAEVFSNSNNFKLWDCFSTFYSNAIELAYIAFSSLSISSARSGCVSNFKIYIGSDSRSTFIFYIFLPWYIYSCDVLGSGFNIKCLFTVCFFFLSFWNSAGHLTNFEFLTKRNT